MGGPIQLDVTDGSRPGRNLPLQVRLVSPHSVRLHAHLARLSDADRALRLGRPVSPRAIEAYCTRGRSADAVILGGFVGSRLIASAELAVTSANRLFAGPGTLKADMLVAVEPPHRRCGHGLSLCQSMIRHAPLRRIALVRMTCDPANTAMVRLASALGAVNSRVEHMIHAELCTGWLGGGMDSIQIKPDHRFRPLTLR